MSREFRKIYRQICQRMYRPGPCCDFRNTFGPFGAAVVGYARYRIFFTARRIACACEIQMPQSSASLKYSSQASCGGRP